MSANTALLIIDVQQGFDNPVWGQRNNSNAEENIARLISTWRKKNRPVIHVQHCSVEPNSPLHPDSPGVEFKPEAIPIGVEPIFQKTVNSAFIGTNLEKYLRKQGIENLVIVGLTTDHCVSTSARMAGNLGFNVWLVSDATATFGKTGPDGKEYSADEVHAVNLASLHDEFCQVVTTKNLIDNA
ncbi:MAG: cysteine hydrolase [Anaerolineae bacterium]|nr:cysteine hydrolase [Anaerolineae bacterium]MBT7189663.1 cysteine hydrolase [Anaerolineae bacterium]MBT7991809.1 cysteine hydrolase [Anaerolineae bacterium]